MRSFVEELNCRRLLFDGSMGTLLSSMGQKSEHPESFTVEQPNLIQSIHNRYIESGADVIITDSLGATPIHLMRAGLSECAAEWAEASVRVAKKAAGNRAFVALDMGPTGEFMQPTGRWTLRQMMENYIVCAQAGANAGADLILLETMTDVAECRVACLAAQETGLPVAASFTFGTNGRTLTGSSPECAALILSATGASALGINCSQGPIQMVTPLKAMRAVTPLPIIIQPNAGLPAVDEHGQIHYRFAPKDMLPYMKDILDEGAAAIGGCCGTTPEHIHLFSTLDMTTPPISVWDGRRRICSSRCFCLLEDVLDQAVFCEDVDDLYELEDAPAALIDLRTLSSLQETEELLIEAQMATNVPLIFRADDAEILESALLNYPGVAAVYAPSACECVCQRYGAILL